MCFQECGLWSLGSGLVRDELMEEQKGPITGYSPFAVVPFFGGVYDLHPYLKENLSP